MRPSSRGHPNSRAFKPDGLYDRPDSAVQSPVPARSELDRERCGQRLLAAVLRVVREK